MAVVLSSWMLGSVIFEDDIEIMIDGGPEVLAAGSYYLYDATDGLNLLKQIADIFISAAYAGTTAYVRKDRKVEFDFNGSAPVVTFPAELEDILGFGSSPYEADLITAETVSTLLWSAGWPETTTRSPVGVAGRKRYDRIMTASPTGLTYDVTLHHSTTVVDLSWSAVRQSRTWTADEAGGEFVRFFEDVIVPGYRMKLYPNVSEDDESSDEVTWPTALGPYVVPAPDYDWYERFVPVSDSLGASFGFQAMLTSEYS